MKRTLGALLLLFAGLTNAFATPAAPHTFVVKDGSFQLDGKPFQIISGEMHYPRIPRARWRQSFRMARAMGLNTITTYVFWNLHEPKPGVYDFSGNNDVAEYIREAQQEGLRVILRPGPYVCAEWEFGGFPAWLLKDRTIPLRTTDPRYMTPVKKWLVRLGKELAPLQIANGGPIIAVQVENEYGSYGDDRAYMQASRQALIDAGFGKSLLYSADGLAQIRKVGLPDLLAAANYGPREAKSSMDRLKAMRPTGPYMTGEYWAGWFDHWGERWQRTNAKTEADEIEWLLKQGDSISIYMFQGGTTFGWMNGANSQKPTEYQPDVNSYDYDAAVSEDGQPSAKYALFRDAIARATGVTPPPMPEAPTLVALPPAQLATSISLWKTLPKPIQSEHPLSMEDVGQNYGYILYRTMLAAPVKGDLVFDAIHEYAQVYVDGKLAGTVDRRLAQTKLAMDAPIGARLDVLVEDTGRINYGPQIVGERIGILGDVSVDGKALTGWSIYPLPMEAPQKLKLDTATCTGPCFYRATLHVDAPADTYLDTQSLRKGQVWINGRNLGRFWYIGPQGALFVPASWLKAGANDVVIFDLEAAPGRSVQGLDHPVTTLGMAARAK